MMQPEKEEVTRGRLLRLIRRIDEDDLERSG